MCLPSLRGKNIVIQRIINFIRKLDFDVMIFCSRHIQVSLWEIKAYCGQIVLIITKTICRCWLICSDLMQRKGTTCIQKLKEQMTCNYGSTRAPLMKRMLCREMIFAL